MPARKVKEIEVVAIENGEVVHRVDCHGRDEYSAEKVELGMLINMNREAYFTRMVYMDNE